MRALTLTYCLMIAISGAVSPACAQNPGQPGVFDYYLLTLSWSPEFCYSHRSAPECSEHRGFIVHGLWPQFSDGTWPANCRTNQPAPTDTSPVAGIMPPEIISHEWEKHGTCSGPSGNDYLALIRKVFDSIKIPNDLAAPSRSFTMRPATLKDDFEKSNPSLADQDLAIQLKGGRYLSEVEICLTKGKHPTPRACSSVREVHGGTFVVPPVR
jgi:ribonuclease T2